jgi:hypothetical protein
MPAQWKGEIKSGNELLPLASNRRAGNSPQILKTQMPWSGWLRLRQSLFTLFSTKRFER